VRLIPRDAANSLWLFPLAASRVAYESPASLIGLKWISLFTSVAVSCRYIKDPLSRLSMLSTILELMQFPSFRIIRRSHKFLSSRILPYHGYRHSTRITSESILGSRILHLEANLLMKFRNNISISSGRWRRGGIERLSRLIL